MLDHQLMGRYHAGLSITFICILQKDTNLHQAEIGQRHCTYMFRKLAFITFGERELTGNR